MLGTLVSQTLLNVVALADPRRRRCSTPSACSPAATHALAAVRARRRSRWSRPSLVAPALLWPAVALRAAARRCRRAARRGALRAGRLPPHPRLGAAAVDGAARRVGAAVAELLPAAGRARARAPGRRSGAAAAVLFAVNVTAVLPVTPSNLGVFQAACVAVLTGAYGVRAGDALGYGIVLQAVEIATAFLMGAPALVREGLSWRDVRLRTLHAAPVQLAPRRLVGVRRRALSDATARSAAAQSAPAMRPAGRPATTTQQRRSAQSPHLVCRASDSVPTSCRRVPTIRGRSCGMAQGRALQARALRAG